MAHVLFVRLMRLVALSTVICFGQSTIFSQSSKGNTYRNSISSVQGDINEGQVERVKIYARERADSDKKIERSGVLVRYKDAIATILICHGFMCDKFDVAFLRHLFPKGKFNFMTFDFRAHGENVAGQCCTFGRDEAYDVIAAGTFLKNHPELKNKPLFSYGFSMGAVASIEAQAKIPQLFDAMILDCPYDSTENIIKNGLEGLKISIFGYEFAMPGRSILQKYAFHPYVQSFVKIFLKTVSNLDAQHIQIFIHPVNTAESIKKVSVPCLFIHCKNDDKVPVAAIKTVYSGSAADYKKLWLTNGRRHFDSFFYNPEGYTQQIRKFLERVISGEAYVKTRQKIVVDPDEAEVFNRSTTKPGDNYGA